MSDIVLEIKNLKVSFEIGDKIAQAVNDLSFSVKRGQTIGVVGESGSGKSISALSIMRLIPSPPGKISGGQILFKNQDLTKLDDATIRSIRGKEIAMIFQEPMTALNPVFTIGQQIVESLITHEGMNKKDAYVRAVELLAEVGIAEPLARVHNYPFQMSGGMRQRSMIAIALASNPSVLIADEPTTALDVSVQAQIFQLLKNIQAKNGTSIIFITHDMGSIAAMADRVIVMYAGRCVEAGTSHEVLLDPRHPYTKGLIACIPHPHRDTDKPMERLKEIPGIVPSITKLGKGCAFAPRCAEASPKCFEESPPITAFGNERRMTCWNADTQETLNVYS